MQLSLDSIEKQNISNLKINISLFISFLFFSFFILININECVCAYILKYKNKWIILNIIEREREIR
jgi:hypothetical protein